MAEIAGLLGHLPLFLHTTSPCGHHGLPRFDGLLLVRFLQDSWFPQSEYSKRRGQRLQGCLYHSLGSRGKLLEPHSLGQTSH